MHRAALHAVALATLASAGCHAGLAVPRVSLDDGGADAALPRVELDAGPDCESACTTDDPCAAARCEDGACVVEPREDGAPCSDDGTRLCVERACRARGCGDGWRERGDDARYAREGCDDGADAPDDLCDDACRPRAATLHAGLVAREGDVAIAIDGAGRGLVLAIVRDADGSTLWALHLDARTRAVAPPTALVRAPREDALRSPAIAGLAGGGFAIALERSDEGVLVAVLGAAPAGDAAFVPLARRAGVGGAALHGPSIAALDDGFVVVVTDAAETPEDPLGGIRAQRFSADGRALGAWLQVAEDRTGIEGDAVVAGTGDAWRVAWNARDPLGSRREVRTRLFSGDRPVAPEARVGELDVASFDPGLEALDGEMALAWIAAGTGGAVAQVATIAEDGALRGAASIASDGRALHRARPLPLPGSAPALACVEGASAGTTRWTAPAGAPPELATLEQLPAHALRAVAIDRDRIALAWPDADRIRVLVLPRS